MLSSEENSGIFYFLVGMIVVVLTAVGLSMLVDQRFKFSSDLSASKSLLAASTTELAELRARHEQMAASLAEQQSQRGLAGASRDGLTEKLTTMSQRKSELARLSGRLRLAITDEETKFTKYRADYRDATWTKAVGEEMSVLATRSGREYRQVKITKVTDVGLEIKHEHGIARVQAPDLPTAWQDRFQWNEEERRTRLKAESDSLSALSSSPSVVPAIERGEIEPAEDVTTQDSVDQENLKQLRTQVIKWDAKVSQLRSEQSVAASNANYSGQNSVPGSLETWKAKAARTTKELSRARMELTLAKNKLSAVSPSDSLLRTQPADSP